MRRLRGSVPASEVAQQMTADVPAAGPWLRMKVFVPLTDWR